MKSASHILTAFVAAIMFCTSINAQQQDSDRVYIIVPQMPVFAQDLDKYMQDNLHYPQSAIDRGISGTVNVTFVITKTGQVSSIKILIGVSPDLDSEAVRVVRAMPLWTPGRKDGVPVNVQYNLPVYFVLNNPSTHPHEPPAPWDTVYHLRDGLYVDPDFGFGFGGPQYSSTSGYTLTKGNSYKFGVNLTYMMPSNIGISAGLQIQQYNFSYSYNTDGGLTNSTAAYNGTVTENRTYNNDTTVTAGYSATTTYSFLYAQLPVMCRYISSQENKIGLFAEAGLVANYLVSSQITGTVTQTQYQLSQAANTYWYLFNSSATNSQTVSMPSQNPAKLTMSVHGGLGALIPCSTRISLVIAFSSDIGIMNAGDGAKDEVNFGTSKFYFYGEGNYGSFNSINAEVKLLIKMSASSHTMRIN